MIILGSKFIVWGSQRMAQAMRCGQCGQTSQFILKKGMNFITFFFVIPICPISGVKELTQCPNCGARYNAAGA